MKSSVEEYSFGKHAWLRVHGRSIAVSNPIVYSYTRPDIAIATVPLICGLDHVVVKIIICGPGGVD